MSTSIAESNSPTCSPSFSLITAPITALAKRSPTLYSTMLSMAFFSCGYAFVHECSFWVGEVALLTMVMDIGSGAGLMNTCEYFFRFMWKVSDAFPEKMVSPSMEKFTAIHMSVILPFALIAHLCPRTLYGLPLYQTTVVCSHNPRYMSNPFCILNLGNYNTWHLV